MPTPITVKHWQTVVEIPSVQVTCPPPGASATPMAGVHVACGPCAEQDNEKLPGPPGALQVARQSVTGFASAEAAAAVVKSPRTMKKPSLLDVWFHDQVAGSESNI
jgi:hypothetical protein